MSYDNLSSVSQNILKSEQQFTHEETPSQRVCGGRKGTRFLRPRGTIPLKGPTPRELRGMEMGPRASSA
jgi:hypothetical protein